MPEGPEVETIRGGLSAGIVGQKIKEVGIIFAGSFVATDTELKNHVLGREVLAVERRGKVLIITLGGDYSLLVHLKMTGQMVFVKKDGERYAGGHPSESMRDDLPDKSTRVRIEFESGDSLFFNDQRKFGWIKLVRTEDIGQEPLLARMGPEALDPAFTPEYLGMWLRRHAKAPVKAVILDQSVVAGIGNIYADESLNLAKIHPATPAGSVSAAKTRDLTKAIQEIMRVANAAGGTSFSHYVNSFGGRGDYLSQARVFRRTGEPCPSCGTAIIKTRVAGRGTHLCPVCQKAPTKVSSRV
jgi:formamidopyrimidine-DNA glycosylase